MIAALLTAAALVLAPEPNDDALDQIRDTEQAIDNPGQDEVVDALRELWR